MYVRNVLALLLGPRMLCVDETYCYRCHM